MMFDHTQVYFEARHIWAGKFILRAHQYLSMADGRQCLKALKRYIITYVEYKAWKNIFNDF